ncbi:MATE family efflux transporter [Arsenophonus symbiont of Ornithomya chloropus]|uniref:MATE family efflux transporter n=1 Tax=Arsenophonus symbiont of Ornithomya chloropus TaxID=634121 RepID=UPI0032B178DE
MHSFDVTKRSLYSLSWPIFIDVLLHFSTLLINTYMVSHVSTSYLAAMGVGNQVFDLFITIFNFISIGCSVVIAQYLGAIKTEKATQAIHIAIAFNFLLGFLGAVIILFLGHKILGIMNTPIHLLHDGYAYLHVLGLCLIPEAISIILAACLRVYGKSEPAMWATFIANVITIIGNVIVLYGFFDLPKYGLIGVAYSTTIGRIIATILLFFLLFSKLKIKFSPNLLFNWSKKIVNKILHIGIPSAGENLVWILHYIIASAFIGIMGEIFLAAQTIYFQLSLFIMLFGISISIGNEIIIGHLIGSKRFKDAYKRAFKSLKWGFCITICIVFIFWLFRISILNIVTQDSKIMTLLLPLFLLSVFLEPGRTVNIIMVNALRAVGDAKFPFCVALVSMFGIALPISYLLGIKMQIGLLGIWLGFLCDEWLRGLLNTWRWKSKYWQKKN